MKIYHKEGKMIYREGADYLFRVIASRIKEEKNTLLLLSGGSSVNLYHYLSDYICHAEPRKHLALVQVDERKFNKEQITKNKEQINAYQIGKTGLWEICKEKGIPCNIVSQEGLVEKAAEEYNEAISKLWNKYDYKMAVLGIGEDCHTAGLIPGYEKEWDVDRYVAGYNLGQEKSRDFSCQYKFRQRITVTPKLLKMLDYALIVVVGEKKEEAIQNALKKENLKNLNKYPAAIIQKIKEVDMFTDIPVS